MGWLKLRPPASVTLFPEESDEVYDLFPTVSGECDTPRVGGWGVENKTNADSGQAVTCLFLAALQAPHKNTSVSHPALHCGLFDNVLQPLLMVPHRFGAGALFFFLLLLHRQRRL